MHCTLYLDFMRRENRVNTITLGAQASAEETLGVQVIRHEDLQRYQRMFAEVIYMSTVPFQFSASPYMAALFKRIAPAFTIPSPRQLSGPLLDEVYESTKAAVYEKLASAKDFNIITDETSDISYNRILNLSVMANGNSFHIFSENMAATRLTAENIARWLFRHLETLTGGNWRKINSVATDTCSIMRAVWDIMAIDPRMLQAKTLFIPCDAHGLQLLVKDIVENIPIYSNLAKQTGTIVCFFHKSPLQYALLRHHQQQQYGKPKALISAAITRWGTYYASVTSLMNNRKALAAYILDPMSASTESVRTTILDRSFWFKLEELGDVLSRLDDILKIAEANTASLSEVFSRWESLYTHLENILGMPQYRFDAIRTLIGKRASRQLKPEHYLAHFLDPKNRNAPLYQFVNGVGATMSRVYKPDLFNDSPDSEPVIHQAVIDFYQFRNQEGPFSADTAPWRFSGNSEIFWQMMRDQ
jgi:hypothetical protein